MDGKVFGFPNDISLYPLCYNKALLDESGIAYPASDNPLTFDEYYEMAKKLTKIEGNAYTQVGFADEARTAFRLQWLFPMYGGSMFDQTVNPTKITIDTPEGRKGVEAIAKMADVVAPVAEWGKSWDGGLQNSAIATCTSGIWMFGDFKKAGVDFGVAPMPEGIEGSAVTGLINGFMMASNCENKEAAWQVLKWLSSRDGQLQVAKDRLLEEKLIVILRGLAEEKLIATVDILKNMGMHFFELAIDNESELSMEKSLRNIEGLRKHYGDSIHIGAGTVINKLQVKRVAEIGGEYIISPNLNEEVVRATKEMGLVSIPGAATPSEIIRAYQAGADIVKVFPANYLGEAYIRAIKAPLDYIPIAAVGGIRPEDIPAFQSAGVSCFGVGKQLVDAGLFSSYCDEEVFQIIEDRAKRYLQAIR